MVSFGYFNDGMEKGYVIYIYIICKRYLLCHKQEASNNSIRTKLKKESQ